MTPWVGWNAELSVLQLRVFGTSNVIAEVVQRLQEIPGRGTYPNRNGPLGTRW
jgi:hypothetical protein